jgi:hypothetical protein
VSVCSVTIDYARHIGSRRSGQVTHWLIVVLSHCIVFSNLIFHSSLQLFEDKKKRPRHMTLEIHVLASNKHNIVAGLNLLTWFKLSPLYNFISNGKAAMQKTAIKYPHIFCSTQNDLVLLFSSRLWFWSVSSIWNMTFNLLKFVHHSKTIAL